MYCIHGRIRSKNQIYKDFLPYFQKMKEMVDGTTHRYFSYFINLETQERDLDMKKSIAFSKLHLSESLYDFKKLDDMLLVHEGDLFY